MCRDSCNGVTESSLFLNRFTSATDSMQIRGRASSLDHITGGGQMSFCVELLHLANLKQLFCILPRP